MATLAAQLESLVAPRQGILLDDRRLPLFRLGARLREHAGAAWFRAEVIDEELLAQGAPRHVTLEAIGLGDLPSSQLARALETCLVDHPRTLIVYSAALPSARLAELQPNGPSPLFPPLHALPICDDAGVLLVVHEWVSTLPLLAWRKEVGERLILSDIVDVFDTLSEALATLHRRGFAHGALSPDSLGLQKLAAPIIPDEPAEHVWGAKLLDLGLSRVLAAPGTWPAGAEALWCAPEAFLADPATDWRRADQLAVAGLLFLLWTDQQPFEPIAPGTPPAEAAALRRRQLEALPPPRGNKRARALGVTPAMSSACMRAMAPDPADRFPSLDAFGAALRRAQRDRSHRGTLAAMDTGGSTQPGTFVGARFSALSRPPQLKDAARSDAATNPGHPRTPASRSKAPDDDEDGPSNASDLTRPTVPLPFGAPSMADSDGPTNPSIVIGVPPPVLAGEPTGSASSDAAPPMAEPRDDGPTRPSIALPLPAPAPASPALASASIPDEADHDELLVDHSGGARFGRPSVVDRAGVERPSSPASRDSETWPRDPPTVPSHALPRPPPGPWAFNRLGAVLVAGWAVTALAFAFTGSSAHEPPAPAAVPAPPAPPPVVEPAPVEAPAPEPAAPAKAPGKRDKRRKEAKKRSGGR